MLGCRVRGLVLQPEVCSDDQRRASRSAVAVVAGGATQRTQYPFIMEHTLNHNIKAPIIGGIFLN